ncbi:MULTISPECIES: IDEAL domain-containing protein [Brevibacillus]|uniref:IDEAL domain-containing protein n=1 Tax=Brevibacillus brevis (strain 47 / JCM 6285 / NBRC 100599) TaxID=358681 RepID=C0ZCF5_BREBN|nr:MULTISPECIES: IDEAL domain-containing protein [Bacillales]MBH0329217.1 IDEAL domain containing protein [Brevibacillus brevis]NRR03065.1 IDEAL domain-containing protein [Brevibacillus sp. RS1.1]OUQ87070.1 IDEAL domain containing protein [Brevibacillus brevis]TQR37684.1 IDEAL domain-containing protein [Lysinibacillus sp. SDF0063]UIO44862.1 IDEAL domain-containing protein [Brevibacillus brevis]
MEWPNFYSNAYGTNNQMVSGLLSEMVIDEQMRQYRKRTLVQEIDEALASKNKELFLRLTDELKEIMAYEQA